LTKSDIIGIISEGTGLTKIETQAVIDGLLATIGYALQQGDRVDLRGFGSFKVVERKARVAKNPRTGEAMEIPRRYAPVFKASKDLRQFVNKSDVED